MTRRSGGDVAPEAGQTPGFDIVGTADEAEWLRLLAQTVQHDFHHLPGYHRLAERRGEGTACLFTYRDGEYLIALPLLLRPVDDQDPAGLLDATSVYGYGGPVSSHLVVPARVVRSFQAALRDELVARRVVTVFSRLHPLIPQRDLLDGLGELRPNGLTVSVDLTLSPEAQWAGYAKKCRKIIERARDAGVVCVHDRDRRFHDEWVAIYGETMQRVNASDAYLFDQAYFDALAEELGAVLQLFVALVDGEVVAAGLYTICDGIVQAHLGALKREYLKLSPTRLLDDTARRWAYESGARAFHLGGGVGGQQDSLFMYKAGFSDRRHEFATWRWIVDTGAYQALCDRRDRVDGGLTPEPAAGEFFPAYRRPPAPTVTD